MSEQQVAARPASTSSGELQTVEAARDRILAAIAQPLRMEKVAVAEALGRVLGAPVVATTDLPPWDNSAMDGYAVRAADVAAATEDRPITLDVIGEIKAGSAPDMSLRQGTAARIATGAPVPEGADAVVAVEETTPVDAVGNYGPRGRDASGPVPARCLVYRPVRPGSNVRLQGSDLTKGTEVLAEGRPLTAAAIALAAGSGVATVSVHARPRVAVLATGDEVRAPGEELGPAGIPDANGPGLRALVRAAGGEAVDLGIAVDRLEDVVNRLRTALESVDVIVVSGGVSVGPYDVVKLAFETIGQVDLWRVAVQPGKPFAFGVASRPGSADGPPILLFGLPGNPVSSFVTFELFVRPALRRLSGHHQLYRPVDRAVLLEPVSKAAGRRAFLRVVSERAPDGGPARDDRGRALVRLAGGQGSHILSALAAADALAVVPETTGSMPAGGQVELWWLDRE